MDGAGETVSALANAVHGRRVSTASTNSLSDIELLEIYTMASKGPVHLKLKFHPLFTHYSVSGDSDDIS